MTDFQYRFIQEYIKDLEPYKALCRIKEYTVVPKRVAEHYSRDDYISMFSKGLIPDWTQRERNLGGKIEQGFKGKEDFINYILRVDKELIKQIEDYIKGINETSNGNKESSIDEKDIDIKNTCGKYKLYSMDNIVGKDNTDNIDNMGGNNVYGNSIDIKGKERIRVEAADFGSKNGNFADGSTHPTHIGAIMTADEILALYSKIARGEELDQFGLEASLRDRLSALNELAKRIIDLPAKMEENKGEELVIRVIR